MHTHFSSATFALSAFLSIVLVGTLWRLVMMHAATSKNPTVRGLAKAGAFQY